LFGLGKVAAGLGSYGLDLGGMGSTSTHCNPIWDLGNQGDWKVSKMSKMYPVTPWLACLWPCLDIGLCVAWQNIQFRSRGRAHFHC
jgi:hypothetical protein